jgi:putative ABC transport system permease protein
VKRLFYEFNESFRIAFAQIRANKMRSGLTALGVIIGIIAVTLMGTAINGIDIGFQRSLSMLGDDVLYVQKWPWGPVEDWWNYQNRPKILPEDAERLNRSIEATPSTLLQIAVPIVARQGPIKAGENLVNGVYTFGTTAEYSQLMTADFGEGRLFSDTEVTSGREVCVLGLDVAEALFPGRSAMDQTVLIKGQPFRVIGVLAKQGSFLGLFSMDTQAILPITAYRKFFGIGGNGAELHVKVRDKKKIDDAKEELIGTMRRLRGLLPGERDNFSINQQQAFKEQLDTVKRYIALGGFMITGLALFVGAIGIMNITFVSVKERTKEIGTRKALGARRRTILLQFLIESMSISLVGGVFGVGLTFAVGALLSATMPALPIAFSPALVLVSLLVSVATGIISGFAPAVGASRLDPVVALRYE